MDLLTFEVYFKTIDIYVTWTERTRVFVHMYFDQKTRRSFHMEAQNLEKPSLWKTPVQSAHV
jgi:hypothetical protein